MEECIFCKIINGEIPSKKVYEDEYSIAFEDISPKAKCHIIYIPKKHIESLNDIKQEDEKIISNMLLNIKKIAKLLNLYDTGYRVISNVGENGGQEVKHLHFHIMGGEKLPVF